MRQRLLLFTLIVSLSVAQAQSKKDKYQYTVDLTHVVNDKVFVELSTPSINKDEVIFYLPKIVPGTYDIEDYGRFASELTALDKKGKKLPVEKIDQNSWRIKNAQKLTKLTYWIDDTFDSKIEGPEIFWPAGTNIEDKKNFVINTGGFLGYFEGMKEKPFQFNVIRQPNFYGSTGLIPLQTGVSPASVKLEKSSSEKTNKVDIYQTNNYDELIDSPLMYSQPDTAVIKVANAEVLIGAYSPNKKITARQIAESLREVLMAQKEFLGGKLPVDKYAFIFYFTDTPVNNFGALEHSYSSMYFMPEATIDEMNQELRDMAAHEFFHIVTPLTVHSDEIAHFDFNAPKMSQHLWMYEGVTEYFASNVQVKYGLITPEQYAQVLQEKMFTSDQFINDVPFTDISKYTLDKYHDQYYNVYQKGALIGLCLDIKLLQLSKGKYGVRNLMLDLSKKYGKNLAFHDDELIGEITKMTYPEIGTFFDRYVRGTEKLPLKETFNAVGINYTEEELFEDYSIGIGNETIGITEVEGKQKLQISDTTKLNEMGKALGFKQGDVLVKMNGETVPDLGPLLGFFFQQQFKALPEKKTLTYSVLRKDQSGVLQPIELSAPVTKIKMVQRHLIKPNEAATEEQLAIRKAWLQP